MRNKYFSPEDTLAYITDKYPELIKVLKNRGFSQLSDEKKRKEFGSKISLKQAALLKGLNLEKLLFLMLEKIENKSNGNESASGRENTKEKLRVEGLLPCPVRNPLLEKIEEVRINMDYPLSLDLRSASQGLDWLKERLSASMDEKDLADIFISAGFDLFFDHNLMDRFRRQGVFKDTTGINRLNKVFTDEGVDLLDPQGDYSVLGVVPAVFMINKEELKGRKIPKSWDDILSAQFSGSVSLPVSDFDLFNAIILNIYKKYGEKGIDKLGRSLMKSQHPAQMIRDGGRKKTGEAAVTIMPYFFTRMAGRFPHMEFIWPEDGAIISPIFMLTKKKSLPQVQPLVDFFASPRMGNILAVQGLFPSVLPGVDNNLTEGAKFMWPGWEYLRGENPGMVINKMTRRFNQIIKEAS